MTNRQLIPLALVAALTTGAAGQIGPGRRLAAVAGTRSQQRVEGDRPAQAVAGRPVRRSCGRCRASAPATASIAIKDDRIFVQGSAGGRSVVYALNRADGKGLWSKALGRGGQQRQGIRAAKHADGRRRPRLRADRERRSGVPESAGRRVRVAAQHPEGLRRPQHQLAAQRVAARRRRQRHRDARRAAAPAWSRSTRCPGRPSGWPRS